MSKSILCHMFYIQCGTLITVLPICVFHSFPCFPRKNPFFTNNPCVQIAPENEVLLTAMPEVIQSATAKKLSSEIYFTSGATLRDTLRNTFAKNNSSFIESTRL